MLRKFTNQFYKWAHRTRLVRARLAGVELGEGVCVGRNVDFNLGAGFRNSLRPRHSAGRILIGADNWIEQGCVLWAFGGRIVLGRGVFLGPYSVIYGHGGVEVGEETLIAMHCSIVSSNHAIPDRDRIIRQQPDVLLPTRIGRDVWLGAGVRVLGGVTIGDGCVVGAGSVVSRDLPPYSIAVGTPARVIGERGAAAGAVNRVSEQARVG